jgi:hypothetical protein
MPALQAIFRSYPAISRTLGLLFLVNVILWVGIRLFLHDNRPCIYLLGDSCIRNYRMAPGKRMEDILQKMLPDMRVENWAETGTSPLDFLLQFNKGTLLGTQPSCVIVVMAPDKMLGLDAPRRVHNADLRWLPLDRVGLRIWRTLSDQERNVAVVERSGLLLYGFADLIRYSVINYWKWPRDREAMHRNSLHRRKEIEKLAQSFGEALDTMAIGSAADFDTLIRTRDTRLLLAVLKESKLPHLIILHPYGNPRMLNRTFSPRALAKRDTIVQRMRNWLDIQQTAYIDFNMPSRLHNFPDSVWDDNAHLKAAQSFYYLSQQTVYWLAAKQIRPINRAATAYKE